MSTLTITPCPSWCSQTAGHSFTITPDDPTRTHERTVGSFTMAANGQSGTVVVEALENLRNGWHLERQPAGVTVYTSNGGVEDLDASELRHLANLLSQAADMVAEVTESILSPRPATPEEALERLDAMSVMGVLAVADALGLDNVVAESQALVPGGPGRGWAPDDPDLPSPEALERFAAAARAIARERIAQEWTRRP